MKRLFSIIKILVSILVIWFLVHTSKLDFKLLIQLIYSPLTLLFIISLYFIVVGISCWRWHALNSAQDIRLSFQETLLPTYLGIAFNNILPGGVGGDFYRCYFLFKKIPDKRSAAMLSILFDRITGLLGIFIAAGLAISFRLKTLFPHLTIFNVLIFLSIILSTCLVVFITTSFLLKSNQAKKISHRLSKKQWFNAFFPLFEAIKTYRNSKRVIFKCLAASLAIQIMIVITCQVIAQIIHIPSISFSDYMIAVALTQIVNLIPIAPGGFGIGEAAFANVLVYLNPGIITTYATIFLAYRIIGILAYLPGVLVFILDSNLLKSRKAAEVTSL